MGEIVAGFGVPHSPGFPSQVIREGPDCMPAQLYREVAHQLDEVQADVMIVFDSDHLNTFFLNPLPAMCIGVTDQTEGPNDGTSMPHYVVPVAEQIAGSLHAFGLDRGFDLAVNQEFSIDHSILVPLHFLRPQMDLPIVPLFINGIVPPLPAAKRCLALGNMVRNAAASLPAGTKVAVLASGDFSNDIGGHLSPPGQYAGTADQAWADTVIKYMRASQINDLLNEATSERMARAGNVAGELLNWIAMLGAIGDRAPRFLEPEAHRGHAFGVWRWD